MNNHVRAILAAAITSTVLTLLTAAATQAQSNPPPAWYGVDALGRSMPDASQVRAFRGDRYVGIFYFLWMRLGRVYDNSRILKDNPTAGETNASPPWGPPHAYHFWGEPLFGYYRSDDPWVLRRHVELLSDAGVDFLVFDATNAVTYDKVVSRLCEVLDEQRRLGERVPGITFMVNTRAGKTARHIVDTFYKPTRFRPLWFHWKGKPLLLCDPDEAPKDVIDGFTLRKAHWPFQLVNTHNEWHWEATYPQVFSYDTDPSQPEQVNVSVAQNLHQKTGRVEMMSTGNARGRSFHHDAQDQRQHASHYGFNFQEQWQRAFQLDPEVVFITGWNEWIAMQLNRKTGPPVFCDQFNQEFSRDVEMMRGGHTDNYYMQMAANIRRFKGMNRLPVMRTEKTIETSGSFSQWDDVVAGYADHALETQPRDFPGCGDTHYRVTSGRNDFRSMKVAHDRSNVYFYVQTAEDITPHTDPNWMWLLIGIQKVSQPHWEGFHFIVNRHVISDVETSLEACTGGWRWKTTGAVKYRVAGSQMQIAIPKDWLGVHSGDFVVEFKWIDNAQEPGNIQDAYINGDAAPAGRFRYRYVAASPDSPAQSHPGQ